MPKTFTFELSPGLTIFTNLEQVREDLVRARLESAVAVDELRTRRSIRAKMSPLRSFQECHVDIYDIPARHTPPRCLAITQDRVSPTVLPESK